MPFITDQQTINDLNIIGHRGQDSIYNIFARTITRQGAALLEDMFRHPLSDITAINNRSKIFHHFTIYRQPLPFERDLFDIVERYLSVTDDRIHLDPETSTFGEKIAGMLVPDSDYNVISQGVMALVSISQDFKQFITQVPDGSPYDREKETIQSLLDIPIIQRLIKEPRNKKLSYKTIAAFDNELRFQKRKEIKKLLQHIYALDVYIAVAGVAVEKKFSFANAIAGHENRFILEGIYHPQVPNAVSNTLLISPSSTVLFLTGANMAGKSTFMKTFGISLYLAHMGFPVPAVNIEFSVLDGMYTTINLPDNLGMGASHFFSEVQRIKKVAGELSKGRRLLLIFDELFRGTNVKDAYDATIALTSAFTKRTDSVLMLSTHIVEAGPVLRNLSDKIRFIYLPTRMNGNKPVYTYQLEEGITEDRHGMVIVRNEGILDILREGPLEHSNSEQNQAAKNFEIDAQTSEDLNLLGKYKSGSVYRIFNEVKTAGGEQLMEQRFQQPVTDPEEINRRTKFFSYIQSKSLDFPFDGELLTNVEEYLRITGSSSAVGARIYSLKSRLMEILVKDESYDQLKRGIQSVITLLQTSYQWMENFKNDYDNPAAPLLSDAKRILEDDHLQKLIQIEDNTSFSWMQTGYYHHLFTGVFFQKIERLCEIIYEFDLACAVSNIAQTKGFCYAKALPASDHTFYAKDLRHPALDKGVGNTMHYEKDNNIIFLTGANMAGKSTLMKSFGICMYLAHMGFPVPASEMTFSVKDGLYCSINIADNLATGYSHFYAEIMRVKQIAEELRTGKNLVVIFDELFKGTNVKDAYDATLAVTSTFPLFSNCWFLVSTHITEVGDALQGSRKGIQFKFLPTIMENNIPRYTYLLEDGISTDRHGMLIIRNEKIVEIIESSQVTA